MNVTKRLLSLSLFVPYEGVPHAGGDYLRRHFDVLARDFEISLFSPAVPENIGPEVRQLATIDRQTIVGGSGLLAGRLAAPVRAALKLLRGASLAIDVERSLKRSPSFREALKSADVVELQWTEAASMVRFIKRHSPGTPIVLVVHDVLDQRWGRAAGASLTTRRRLFFRLRQRFARQAEKRAYRAVSRVMLFSQKDLELARAIEPGGTYAVVEPGLYDPEMSHGKGRTAEAKTVLFTGALNRTENAEGAAWLIKSVWPLVARDLPEVELTVVGAAPPTDLRHLADATRGVTVEGFVPSLSPYYRTADVFVVPLFTGAGVKFKTITAMMWEIPVVATPVGAEGVGDSSMYVAVTSSPAAFAAAIVRALKDDNEIRSVVGSAAAWTNSVYGIERYSNNLRALYL